MTRAGLLGATLLGASFVAPLWAHPLSPALLELRESGDGLVTVMWKVSSLRLPGTELRPVLPPPCRTVSDPVTSEADDSVTTWWTVDCRPAELLGQRVGVEGLARARTDALVRVTLAGGPVIQGVARPSEPSLTLTRPSPVVVGYVALGIEHILCGPDHLLFVLGLVLLSDGLRRLLGTVTAFTVGHSVTLSLALFGVLRIPSAPVEVAIAASIYLVAVELARDVPRGRSLLRRAPWMMALGFGLLHGLGFAAALREAGLPPDDVPRALLSFNLGIELGQMAFVLCVLVTARALHRMRGRLPPWSARAPAYAIGSLAVFWCLERVAALVA